MGSPGLNEVLELVAGYLKPIFQEALSSELKTAATPAQPPEIVEIEVLRHKEYLSAKEVQKLFGLNHNTLRSWRGQGRGPAYSRDGDLILYKRSDVEAYLKSNRVRTYDQIGK